MSKGSKILIILTSIFILCTCVAAVVLSQSTSEISISKGVHPSVSPADPNVSGKLNINTATVQQLTNLPGIGESLAQAIVDYRTENGAFRSVGELTNVNGIGSGKLEAIVDMITVGG